MTNKNVGLASVLVATILLGACSSTYMIRGAGVTSCVDVVEQVEQDNRYRSYYSAWLLGYLTRYNYDNDLKLGAGFDDGTLVKTAVQYCTANPLDDFDRAADFVVQQLREKS